MARASSTEATTAGFGPAASHASALSQCAILTSWKRASGSIARCRRTSRKPGAVRMCAARSRHWRTNSSIRSAGSSMASTKVTPSVVGGSFPASAGNGFAAGSCGAVRRRSSSRFVSQTSRRRSCSRNSSATAAVASVPDAGRLAVAPKARAGRPRFLSSVPLAHRGIRGSRGGDGRGRGRGSPGRRTLSATHSPITWTTYGRSSHRVHGHDGTAGFPSQQEAGQEFWRQPDSSSAEVVGQATSREPRVGRRPTTRASEGTR